MPAKAKSRRPVVPAGLQFYWRMARADVAPLLPLRRELAAAPPRAQAVVRFLRLAQREMRA